MTTNLYTGRDIAEILNISKALAYRLIAQGEIRSVRFGRTVRVRSEDLQAFVDSHLSGGPEIVEQANWTLGRESERHGPLPASAPLLSVARPRGGPKRKGGENVSG